MQQVYIDASTGKMFTHVIQLPTTKHNDLSDIKEWCDKIGIENKDWYWTYHMTSLLDIKVNFYFQRENDFSFFMLKWL